MPNFFIWHQTIDSYTRFYLIIFNIYYMCKWDMCKGGCSYEDVVQCPRVEEMIHWFSVLVDTQRNIASSQVNQVIHTTGGPNEFFRTGWTREKRQ